MKVEFLPFLFILHILVHHNISNHPCLWDEKWDASSSKGSWVMFMHCLNCSFLLKTDQEWLCRKGLPALPTKRLFQAHLFLKRFLSAGHRSTNLTIYTHKKTDSTETNCRIFLEKRQHHAKGITLDYH